jgi:hypothetical protein
VLAAHDGTRWVKASRPVLEPDRPLDDAKILCPWVLPLLGGFRLFYMGHGSASAPGTHGRILSAWSDDGVSFRKEPGVRVDNGAGAEARALSPCVVATDGGAAHGGSGYRMYFEAASNAEGERSAILSASSFDGVEFVREPGVRVQVDGARVGSPRALLLDDGRVRLYFHVYPEPIVNRLDRGNHVLSAISVDGVSFEREAGVRIPQTLDPRERAAVYCASMVALGGRRVRAFYGAWNEDERGRGAIMTALSVDDGLTFVKAPVPCIAPGSGLDALDASFASEPSVYRDAAGRLRMVYEACDAAGVTRILAATPAAGPA